MLIGLLIRKSFLFLFINSQVIFFFFFDSIEKISDLFLLSNLGIGFSPAKNIDNKKTYFYGKFLKDNRLTKENCYDLINYFKFHSNSFLRQEAKTLTQKYLKDNFVFNYKLSDTLYHKYFKIPTFQKVMRYETLTATLGLDIASLEFVNPDNGDIIDLHHIFGNKESILFRDIVGLTHSSHRAVTGIERGMSAQQRVEHAELLYTRRAILFSLSNLEVNTENEQKIREEFDKDIWDDMVTINKEEWIQRWKDKDRMTMKMWFSQYNLKSIFEDYYDAIFILNRDQFSTIKKQYQFSQWFFNVYVPFYSSKSDNK